MSDSFKELVEEMARLGLPEDDTEESRGRREAAASELGTPTGELDESDIIASADDEFLCSEALALWAMIRKGRPTIPTPPWPRRKSAACPSPERLAQSLEQLAHQFHGCSLVALPLHE